MDPKVLIDRLERYSDFLTSIRDTDAKVWSSPIGEGKWSIHDIVAHIMMWDRNCVETRVRPANQGTTKPVAEELDGDAFNQRSALYGRTLTKERLIDQAARDRSELLRELRRLPSEAFGVQHGDGNCLTPKGYASFGVFLEQEFVFHDQHHMEQIQSYLDGRSRSS